MRLIALDVEPLRDRAANAEVRAARAWRHGEIARRRARLEARKSHAGFAAWYVREAEAHEAAARVNDQTAALYRRRIARLLRS